MDLDSHQQRGFNEGMIVEAINCPQWGPGKIVHIGNHIRIVFRDEEGKVARKFPLEGEKLRLALTQNDPILDNLPPLFEKDGYWHLPVPRISFATAERTFLRHFPCAFSDPKYIAGERLGKDKAHNDFHQQLNVDEYKELLAKDDISTLVKRAISAKAPVNELLAPFENAAFHDALRDFDAARRFFASLLSLLESPVVNAGVFETYIDAVSSLPAKKSRVASWPIATLFPHIAQPDRHMFLKPEKTKAAAETLGFDLRYNTILNWDTYDALLRMGDTYLGLLKNRGAKDFVDVQSFIFVAGGGYDA